MPGPRGCAWSQGEGLVLGGCLLQGVGLLQGGVPGPRGCAWSCGGVPGLGGVVHLVSHSPPPVDRMTHASENITLPQTSFAGGN